MTPNHFYILLVIIVAIERGTSQNLDELQIPVENDNQFPPDNHSDPIEGSGVGIIDEPTETTTELDAPPIEQIESKILLDDISVSPNDNDGGCPKPCVCRVEGEKNDFIIDCSGYELTKFPIPLNENVTVLNIQKNKITEIPKYISSLKNLRVINAGDNSIINLSSGSVSELPELITLDLANNRLIEYPNDLKNSFSLTKLRELDLGGNDMRTLLSSEDFSNFVSLRTLILPSTNTQLKEELCITLASSLLRVCTESCAKDSYECQDEPSDDDIPVLPGMIAASINDEDNFDDNNDIQYPKTETTVDVSSGDTTESSTTNVTNISEGVVGGSDFSFRSVINKQSNDESEMKSADEPPTNIASSSESTIKVGATTSDKTTGGVDKSIIGLVVAGMIVIVAVITVKKNWSSIKKRFGSNSNSRTPNERVAGNANGTTPEEVPLQDKSPV